MKAAVAGRESISYEGSVTGSVYSIIIMINLVCELIVILYSYLSFILLYRSSRPETSQSNGGHAATEQGLPPAAETSEEESSSEEEEENTSLAESSLSKLSSERGFSRPPSPSPELAQ